MRWIVLALLVGAGCRAEAADRAPRHPDSSTARTLRADTGELVLPAPLPPGTTNAEVNFVAFSAWSRRHGVPEFAGFGVDAGRRFRPAPVDLRSHPGAREYRTMLREGARAGPNFAGWYTVVEWGCGSPCVSIAVVDARTGRVYMHPEPLVTPPIYRRDSRLLVEDPTRFTTDTLGHPIFPMIHFFEWTGDTLVVRDSLDASKIRLPLDSLAWICTQCSILR